MEGGVNMVLTKEIKLLPTEEQKDVLAITMEEYVSLVNDILDYAIALDCMPKLSSASVHAPLPSALRDQCRLDAKSIWDTVTKPGSRFKGKFPVLRKPIANWNNQNYTVGEDFISFPVWKSGKSRRIKVNAIIPAEAHTLFSSCKLGALRITRKGDKWVAQIAYHEKCAAASGSEVMGVDLGIKCPAVSVTSTGKTRFYGNGRMNKAMRRRYDTRRKKLGKAKKGSAIRKFGNKEQRWMRDQDHKVSRTIVNEAVAHGVGTIKLENLENIRKSASTSRKNNHSLHGWSFYRLAQYIEYKAALAGITVAYVNPAYTSQTCPVCGKRHHAKDRLYVCPDCGYHSHRDRVGAVNILIAEITA